MTKKQFSDVKELPVIDMALGARLAGDKPELAEELLTMFVNMLQDDFTAIKNSAAANDTINLAKRIHKLHGAVSYCGLPRLKQATADLDNALNKNHADKVSLLFETFSCEVLRVLEQSR